ncbi:serine/threonine protein kinase [Methylocella silvestris BL2]|uniref:Serine/threonine protein kinase n=1 Tax=Methylocella silvestris (strain DSM 15510 / CIP 108128 / LMG 27833 / NCIMB 13906 / BL2) TaxID=395965 RepID=B8ERL1_METSB|nr:bifunctional serine/threonine-protein kinase/formylglycine-generating enzyme family protein [Methylocella silvestris]ACK51063.1 serine/threonine protein kinase [Methylocella silvestris BL2]
MKEPTSPPLASYALAGPGTRLNDIYVIDRLIATGGMGQVFVGHTIETADKVAIKMIRPELAQSDTYLALFRKEAAALHRSPHEAIVRYYLFTTDPELRCPYLAMEFVEGESLASLLERGPLDLGTVRILQRRLAAGLDVAHRAGVIHRDLSPDNIILPDNDPNRAKIIDFGIARDSKGDATVIGGEFAGKSNYVSPEQIGLFGGEVTTKSDVYSLGLTLAAALVGRPIDMGGLPAEVVRKRSSVPDLSEMPAEMRPLLRSMLQPRPEDRPTMAEVASAPTVIAPAPAGRPVPQKRRWILPAAAAGVAALIGAGAVAMLSLGDRKSSNLSEFPLGAPRLTAEAPSDAAPPPAEPSPPSPASAAAPPPAAPAPPVQTATNPIPPNPGPLAPASPILSAPAGVPATASEPPGAAPDHATAAQLSELKLSEVSPAAPPARPPRPAVEPNEVETAGIVARPAAPSGSSAPSPEGAIRDCDGCPEMLPLPAGVFSMGSNADPSEKPIRKVKVAPFAVGRFPVTEGEWRLCVDAKGCSFDPGGDEGAPVHNLSWDDAAQYVDWLSKLTGHRYRLLSEAEWEYAARGGAPTRYWWGEQFKPDMAACRSCGDQKTEGPPKIGLFPPNGFGLQDVTGSVSQWVADCWHRSFKGAPIDGSAWISPNCPERVLRGGSWNSAPADLRVTNREFYDPKVRYPGHGLRVGRDP